MFLLSTLNVFFYCCHFPSIFNLRLGVYAKFSNEVLIVSVLASSFETSAMYFLPQLSIMRNHLRFLKKSFVLKSD